MNAILVPCAHSFQPSVPKTNDTFIRLATRPFNKVEHLLVKLSVDLLNH